MLERFGRPAIVDESTVERDERADADQHRHHEHHRVVSRLQPFEPKSLADKRPDTCADGADDDPADEPDEEFRPEAPSGVPPTDGSNNRPSG